MPHKTGIKVPAPGWMGAPARLPAVVCRSTSPAAARPRAARAGGIGSPGRGHASTPVCPTNLINVYTYLKTHEDHIRYDHFKAAGLPIGSGLVESACKWLIQQRFKGVGMRWSDVGFNHLLHLRLAWINQRFDSFFPDRVPSPN